MQVTDPLPAGLGNNTIVVMPMQNDSSVNSFQNLNRLRIIGSVVYDDRLCPFERLAKDQVESLHCFSTLVMAKDDHSNERQIQRPNFLLCGASKVEPLGQTGRVPYQHAVRSEEH